ncbi:methylmalonyl-CoA mutase, partial [Streptomyces sp. NPDC058411]
MQTPETTVSSGTPVPDFSDVPLTGDAPEAVSEDQWHAAVKESAGRSEDELLWETPEGIEVKPLYTGRDLEGLDFLGTYPG